MLQTKKYQIYVLDISLYNKVDSQNLIYIDCDILDKNELKLKLEPLKIDILILLEY